MNTEEYANLADMMILKSEIYQNILRLQNKILKRKNFEIDKKLKKVDFTKKNNFTDGFLEKHPLIKHIRMKKPFFTNKHNDIYRFVF